MNEPLSRREFLKKTGLASAALWLAGCEPFFGKDSLLPENNYLSLGSEQTVDLSKKGIENFPDTRMPFIDLGNGQKRFFVSANQRSYTIDCAWPLDFSGKETREVFGPDRKVAYRNGYATVNSVLSLDARNGDHLHGIAHYERHKETSSGLDWRDYTGSIGLIESFDKGLSWKDKGVVISSKNAGEPGEGKVTGVGQPSAIIRTAEGKNWVYVYYLHCNTFNINLSRAPIENGAIGKFEHWTKNGRFEKGDLVDPETSQMIIPAPDTVKSRDKHTALPSVAVYKDRLLMVYETNEAFYLADSQDGIKWENHQAIFHFPSELYPHTSGQEWYSNPTLLSPDQTGDQNLASNGLLLYSKGVWEKKPHILGVRPFAMKI